MTQPPLPQPQSDRIPSTFDQYEAYTPQKLELWNGSITMEIKTSQAFTLQY
ncbi:MAG: hypothetical protein WCQ26_12490 [Pseudanabaena sp. ELA748]